MHRLFLGVLLALSSNSFAMDPSMPSGNFLGKGRSKQVNLLCNESSSRPFPCTTTSKGSKPQPCSLNSKTSSGAAGHWQVAQDQSASSSPQRKSLLVGPSIFKPTRPPPPYSKPIWLLCYSLHQNRFLGYSGRPPICLCGTHSVSSGLGCTSGLQTSTCDAFCNQSIGSDLAKQVCIYCHPSTIK